MGAKRRNAARASGNTQPSQSKSMHSCGEVASYGSLCNSGKASRTDGSRVWERDHIPAKATLLARAKTRFKTMTGEQIGCVKVKVEARGMAVVIPRKSHRGHSPTCGSKNTKPQIRNDSKSAENMKAAVERDTAAMQKHMNKDNPACAADYKTAVRTIKNFDFEDMIEKAVRECQAEFPA